MGGAGKALLQIALSRKVVLGEVGLLASAPTGSRQPRNGEKLTASLVDFAT